VVKRHIKSAIRLVIEADGNLTTLMVRMSKAQLIRALDYLLPTDEEEAPTPK
jgi:hypothetical protein